MTEVCKNLYVKNMHQREMNTQLHTFIHGAIWAIE